MLAVSILYGCGSKDNIMSSSVLGYLKKIQNGVVFSEGFDNQNWLAAEGWTTVQGTPTSTNVISHDGLYSFQCTGTGATLSQISVAISSTCGFAQVWFFDDGTTTGQGPYLKIQLSDGKFASVGVRNNISTTKYCYSAPNVATDAPGTASTASRTTGWHSFSILSNAGGFQIYVDWTTQIFSTGAETNPITNCYIFSGASGDSGSAFGYFDSLLLCISINTQIVNVSTSMVNIYNSSNTKLTGILGSGTITFFQLTTKFPDNFYFEISDPINTTKIQFRSILLTVYPGDIYEYFPTDFSRKITDWQPKENDLINQNMSTSGYTETLFNGFKPKHTFTFSKGVGYELKRKLNEFYDDCDQGTPFSMLIDNVNGVGFGVVSAAPGVATQSLTVMATLSTNPNDNFTVGRKYRIFSLDGSRRQKVTLASKTSTTQLNFTEYLKYPFQQGDYICDDNFMPFLELGGAQDGFAFANGSYLYLDWAQQCQEFTGA